MKIKFLLTSLLFTTLVCGCSKTGPQGEQGPKGDTGAQGPQGEQGPKGDGFVPTDFTKYENKIFYEYNFESEYKKNKIVRYDFVETDDNFYQIPDREYFLSLHEYDWFSSQMKINGTTMTVCWNYGYTEDPIEYTSTSRAFEYWIKVQNYGIVEANTRYFDDYDVDELVFGDDLIIWSSQHVYYSEEYLVGKGIEFVDADDVLDQNKLVLDE